MKCRKCKIEMKEEGKAIKNTLLTFDEGTITRKGRAIIVNVYKCPKCGHSIEK
ncbi:hypothetical protein [uncultured Tenacibaculum sp.]|uniref:hypothetical protein n=1 Tax=uncultured Tenacibaculum sp. TaxID=174713 RepID=UPI00262052A2|nr:hypothetical protein [uncultured Tenacibaculum sp.]